MRYASIRDLDISNGEGVGVALFVQGCSRHCYNCFNQETWDYNGGKEWTKEVEDNFLKLINRPYIKRVSILGGEPLDENDPEYTNIKTVNHIVTTIKNNCPDKKIWLYTGNTLCNQDFHYINGLMIGSELDVYWYKTIQACDVIVDGEYINNLRNFKLKWRGSSNQRVIDVQQSKKESKIVLYCN